MQITVTNLTTNQFTSGLSNVVEIVHWKAEDEGFTIQGSTRLNPPKSIFKPLDELSEAEVVSWVTAKDAKRIKTMLDNTKAKALVTQVAPPWSDDFDYVEPDHVRIYRQTYQYNEAVKRLAQYALSEGRPEVREMQPAGEQVFNEETGELEDVMVEVIVQTAIEPLDATVTQMVYSEDDPMAEPTEQTIRNPLIVKDEEERAAAQAVIDNTPEEIKQ